MKHIDSYPIEYKDALTKLNQEIVAAISFTLESDTDVNNESSINDTIKQLHTQIVKDLFRPLANRQDELLHAVIGVGGEAGELLDCVKKHLYYDKPLDVKNILEEAGDVLFYLKAMLMLLGLDITDVEAYNFKKLSARYPDGKFTTLHAAARLDKVAEEAQECPHTFHHEDPLTLRTYCNKCGEDITTL